MSWKTVRSAEEIKALTVNLKPILGIKPVIYVSCFWILILCTFLFLLLVLPGIRNYGSRLTIETVPYNAAVFLGDRYVGATPLTVFAPAGNHTLTLHLAERNITRPVTIKGRRVLSLFFPIRQKVSAKFTEPVSTEYVQKIYADFAAWTLSTDPSMRFQHPPIARTLSRALWAEKKADTPTTNIHFAESILSHMNAAKHADILSALLKVSNKNGLLTPDSLAQLLQIFIQLDHKYHNIHLLFSDILGNTAWEEERKAEYATKLLRTSFLLDSIEPTEIQERIIRDISFFSVPSGQYLQEYPHARSILELPNTYWIQKKEVTRQEFAQFLQAVPRWMPENRKALIEEQEVDMHYLEDWGNNWSLQISNNTAWANEAVRYVSKYAAEAYAAWFTQEYTASLQVNAVLPSAAEWEWAAFLYDNGIIQDSEKTANMAGGLWEWTHDWYAVNQHVIPPSNGDQMIVMGGSYMNKDAGYALRGTQPPDWTTPFLGFRLLLTEKPHGE